jgi:aryl-alcohol dehydrogenase-like predicted oxidoreductase
MQTGSATAEATAAYAARFAQYQQFYRVAQGLTVSTLGLGTYLGEMTDDADRGYTEAVRAALDGGINFLDTSLNYRHQRSERAIGAALAASGLARAHYVVCTKAGFLVPDAMPLGRLRASELVGNMHSMAPVFLDDQLQRSRRNLGLDTIDVFYLHNPETQLKFVAPDVFYEERVRAAFTCCEAMAASGRIRYYGAATWDGFRRNGMADGLSLVRLAAIARQVAGENHHFRFVQLPFNLSMTEAFGQQAEQFGEERVNIMEAARRLGISVVASATLLQSRLATGLPEQLRTLVPGDSPDAVRAIQFTRSAPGISVALVGMGQPAHVSTNLGVAAVPPLAPESFTRLFS